MRAFAAVMVLPVEDVVIVAIKTRRRSRVDVEFGVRVGSSEMVIDNPSLGAKFGDYSDYGGTFAMMLVKSANQLGLKISRPKTKLQAIRQNTEQPTAAPTDVPEGSMRSIDGVLVVSIGALVLVAAIAGLVVWLVRRESPSIQSNKGFQKVAMVPEIEPEIELGNAGPWTIHNTNPWKEQMEGWPAATPKTRAAGSYVAHVAARVQSSNLEAHDSRF